MSNKEFCDYDDSGLPKAPALTMVEEKFGSLDVKLEEVERQDYRPLDMNNVIQKTNKIISSEEALRDVEPFFQPPQGRLIIFEGLDGCGKTSAIQSYYDKYNKIKPCKIVKNADLDTDVGRSIRGLLASNNTTSNPRVLLADLNIADKIVQLLPGGPIRSALDAGYDVLLDRGFWSLGYNADEIYMTRGKDGLERLIKYLGDLTWCFRTTIVYLNVPVETCMERIDKRLAETGEEKELFETEEQLIKSYRKYSRIMRWEGMFMREDHSPYERFSAKTKGGVEKDMIMISENDNGEFPSPEKIATDVFNSLHGRGLTADIVNTLL